MSTHPRTDKVSTPHIGFYSCSTVPSSFAAELETENESLKKEVETLKTKIVNQCDRIRYLEGATSHACGTPLSIAIKERNEARNKMADALQEVDLRTLDYERMKEERDEAREKLHRVLKLLDDYDQAVKNPIIPFWYAFKKRFTGETAK